MRHSARDGVGSTEAFHGLNPSPGRPMTATSTERPPRKPQRPFAQLDRDCVPTGDVFHSATPRGAALKAANRGIEDIFLLDPERGRIFRYRGWKERPEGIIDIPAWAWKAGYDPRRARVEAQGSTALEPAEFQGLKEACSAAIEAAEARRARKKRP